MQELSTEIFYLF